MNEKNENSHITLNIFNKQNDINNNKSETLSQANNPIPNMLEYLNNGISKEFPDNMRTKEYKRAEEYKRTDFPIKEEKLQSNISEPVRGGFPYKNNNKNNSKLQAIANITETALINGQKYTNENYISNIQPNSLIQKNNMNTNYINNAQQIATNNINFFNKNTEKRCCCGKCSKPMCIFF